MNIGDRYTKWDKVVEIVKITDTDVYYKYEGSLGVFFVSIDTFNNLLARGDAMRL